MFRYLFVGLILFSCSCSSTTQSGLLPRQGVELTGGPVYVVPFETIMVPEEVSENLFDLFIDSLNDNGADKGIEFIILKHGFEEIDKAWLADKSYIRGELFAYIEQAGSTMTEIKARSRIRLYQPGSPSPALQLIFPTEVFFQNDYSSLAEERRKLAERVADNLVTQFLSSIRVQ